MALITGASSGIGAGTALLFSKLGAQLALNGRDMDNLSKVAKECEECGGQKVTHCSVAIRLLVRKSVYLYKHYIASAFSC